MPCDVASAPHLVAPARLDLRPPLPEGGWPAQSDQGGGRGRGEEVEQEEEQEGTETAGGEQLVW